jgi:manganese transport protein
MQHDLDRPDTMPIVSRRDPEELAREAAYLTSLRERPFLLRLGGYFKLSGPGWVQSALTLGGGSGSTSLFAGALAGYALIWVQPAAMALGVIMMAALAHQTLSTGMRPFHAVNRYAHPVLGWGWAVATLIANFVWIFGQFNVSAAVIGDMFTTGRAAVPAYAAAGGRMLSGEQGLPAVEAASIFYGAAAAPFIAVAALWVTWHYSKGSRGIRWFENLLKVMVAGIVICFAIVVFKTHTDWGRVGHSLFSFHIPAEVDQFDVMISAFATAVGINMTFLFPYTLLARGWGRAHRGLAKFDLGVGMLVPFVLATGCIVIASGNVLNPRLMDQIAEIRADTSLSPDQQAEEIQAAKNVTRRAVAMAESLEPLLGRQLSHYVFGLGFLAMTTSSIITMMLVSGFTLNEICGGQINGRAYKIGLAIPALGMFGPLVFGALQMWLMVPISVFCFFFIPIAYVTFFVMMNNRRYMGADRPRGAQRWAWNAGMLLAIAVVTLGGGYKIYSLAAAWLTGG